MNKWSLVRGITGRMIAWGVLGGVALGFIYVLLLFFFTGSNATLVIYVALVGSLFGGFMGLVLGLLDGLVLTAIALFMLPRRPSRRTFRAIVYLVSALLTASGALYAFSEIAASFRLANSGGLLFAVLPTLIAVVLALLAASRVAAWVERNTELGARPE